jgi:glycosyltransferase involved in cell wall biosynthesis
MDDQKHYKRVTAIVPAYNEASRIGRVLEVLTTYPDFREVIVIDDGSLDGTEEVARKFAVRYEKNFLKKGKGRSMDRGVSLATGDVLFFCDADISGLTHEIIDEILGPVLRGTVDMFIGMRNRKWYFGHRVIAFIPLLGGERAMTKRLWKSLPAYYKRGFRVEAALNFYALYHGRGFQYSVFKGLSQVIKEKKYGFWEGTRQRWGMLYDIFSAQAKLHFLHLPEFMRKRRLLGMVALYSAVGMVLGGLFFAAAYFCPSDFVRSLFAEELREDPSAPFAHLLLAFAGASTVETIVLIGCVIFSFSAVMFLATFSKMRYLLYSVIYKIRNNRSSYL